MHQLIGIEMEYENVPSQEAVRVPGWVTKADASLRNGVELVTPPVTIPRGTRSLRTLMRYATERGYTGGIRCGMHVHVDMTHRRLEQIHGIITAYAAFEPVLYTLLPPEREENIYATPWYRDPSQPLGFMRDKARAITRGIQADRYSALNLLSLPRFTTLEFRAAPAWQDYKPAQRWIWALMCVVRYGECRSPEVVASELHQNPNTLIQRVFGSLVAHEDWEEVLDEYDVAGVVDVLAPPPTLMSFVMCVEGQPDAEPIELEMEVS